MLTRIASCTCKSKFQDDRYGIGKRVINTKRDPGKGGTCTVCGKSVSGGEDIRPVVAKKAKAKADKEKK